MNRVIVVGGGAAGAMAAIAAARSGSRTTLFEKNEKIGKKLFITGKGRCNVTNACETEELFGNVVSNGKFHFVPIRDDLKKHGLLEENLEVLENGELQYVQDGNVVSHKGIDVSRYQGDIDWEKVAASGVEYAFIRVGVRGYGEEGRIVLDEKFEDNVKGATAAGVKVGVYFFSQAITDEEALEEADMVLGAIDGYDVTYPIVYDVEKTSAAHGRMNQLSVEDRTRMARIFVDRIKEAGYTPMIYSNMEMWSVLIDMASFEDIEKWFAYYKTDLYFPYEYAVWQYTDKGTVDGIKGDVDLNISFKEW